MDDAIEHVSLPDAATVMFGMHSGGPSAPFVAQARSFPSLVETATPLRLITATPTAVWPVRDGLALRIHHILAALSASTDLTLIADAAQDSAQSRLPIDIRPVPLVGKWRSIPTQYATAPLVAEMNATIAERRPDAILLWPGAEFLAWSAAVPRNVRVVVDRIDSMALTYWRSRPEPGGSTPRRPIPTMLRRGVRRMRAVIEAAAYERRIVRTVDAVIAAGEDDARTLRWLGGRAVTDRVHVITNGVDLPSSNGQGSNGWDGASGRSIHGPTVVFTGTLNYEPNVRAAVALARTIWPRVLADVSNAQLVIAGRNPTEEVLALADLPGVTIRANVPRMEDVFSTAWLAIAPMQTGSGVKNKVLEAWAAHLPVVMTPLAINGLTLPAKHEELVAADPQRLAAIVASLLQAPARCRELGEFAYDLVRSTYTWDAAAEQINALLSADRIDIVHH